MSVPFHYVELRAFCYGTESEERVERALRTLLPEDASLERVESEGHHGDRIVVLSTRLERADEIRHVLGRLRDGADVDRLREEMDERIDENNSLFVHLDKQAAYDGEVRLGDGISLRAKVEAYPATREAAVENAREAL
ncbi:MAG: RNA-binding protein [Halanaeroarchaeum sp.]